MSSWPSFTEIALRQVLLIAQSSARFSDACQVLYRCSTCFAHASVKDTVEVTSAARSEGKVSNPTFPTEIVELFSQA